MPISYFSSEHGFTATHPTLIQGRDILLVDIGLEKGRMSPLDRYRNIPPSFRNVDAVVFRGRGEKFLERLNADDALWRLIAAEGVKTAVLAGGMAKGSISLRYDLPSGTGGDPVDIDSLRQCE